MVRMIICTAIVLIVLTGRIKSSHIENLTEDEDDEDYFGEAREATYLPKDFYRKRRSDEEGFYHTLLSRSEPQHVFKRSHGTEDFEQHNSAYITNRDWTGSSHISDADRKELENLFSKLNADDGPTKTDVARSLHDDDNPRSVLEDAANNYASWLMHQPANKIVSVLTQKAQVDHKLTRLFFEKRGIEDLLPDKNTVFLTEKRDAKNGKDITDNPTSSKLALQNSDAKHLIMAGPKLCNDDSPKCLCTRACYPNAAISYTPCNCEMKNMSKNDAVPLTRSISITNAVTLKGHEQVTMSNQEKGVKHVIDPVARTWCMQACHPLNVASDNPCKCSGNVDIREKVIRQPEVRDNVNTLLNQHRDISGKLMIPTASNAFPPDAPAAGKILMPLDSGKTSPVMNTVVNEATADVVRSQNFDNVPDSPLSTNVSPHGTPKVGNLKNNVAVAANSQKISQPIRVLATLVKEPINATTRDELISPATAPAGTPAPLAPSPAAESAPVPVGAPKGLFGTKEPIYVNHPSYQGCYKDRKPIRDLPKRFTRFDTTPEACISECKYQNYNFAGVQYGYLCFCGNAFGRYGRVSDKDCNSYCNGDSKRRCGAFWHNSVYSVDGKTHDPTTFDFAKIDEEERKFDRLSQPAVKSAKRINNKETHANIRGANAATHLMNAAQAALKAAKKLLPSVSKKQKILRNGKRGKRDDNEEDAELMLQRENVIASLKVAHQIIQKTNFERAKRNSEKEKRSISEDFDPYDPDDGKDLLKAYMSNVDAYQRQVRSVDDEEEEDDKNEKVNFEYRRMTMDERDEGEFVEKYEDADTGEETGIVTKKKRSAEKSILPSEKKDKEIQQTKKIRRSSVFFSHKRNESEIERRQSITNKNEKEPSSINIDNISTERNKHSMLQPTEEKNIKRSIPDTSKLDEKQMHTLHGGSGAGEKKKRSVPAHEGSAVGEKIKRTLSDANKAIVKQLHAVSEGSGDGKKKRRSHEGSAVGAIQRRSLSETNKEAVKQIHSVLKGVGTVDKTKRELSDVNQVSNRKIHITAAQSNVDEKKGSPAQKDQKRKIKVHSVPAESTAWGRKKRSLSVNQLTFHIGEVTGKTFSRQRRDLSSTDLPDRALKMAARSDSNDIEESLQKLESIEKKYHIPEEEVGDESGSEESGDDDIGSGKETLEDSKSSDLSHNLADIDVELSKRSIIEMDKSSKVFHKDKNGKRNEDAKLKSDVEKGVDNLLNLVVELYKQQKTIKAFETSVRSLRHDIMKELKLPSKDKHEASMKVRNSIQAAARERLHSLTNSIEQKITQFAKSHPESSKQANLATSLLPQIPMSDKKFQESKREIKRRSAEFDNIEDSFVENNHIPSILKEHFKRNAEKDFELKKNKVDGNGERTLSRMHRDVSEAEEEGLEDDEYEKLFP